MASFLVRPPLLLARAVLARAARPAASSNSGLLLRRAPVAIAGARPFASGPDRPHLYSVGPASWQSGGPRAQPSTQRGRHGLLLPAFVCGAVLFASSMTVAADVPPQKKAYDLAASPLLARTQFPLFDKISASDVVPSIKFLIDEATASLEALESSLASSAEPSWPALAEPLERLTDRLSVAWGAVNHLKAVSDTPALRAAVDEVQPLKVAFGLRVAQSRPIYAAFKALRDSAGWSALTQAQQRIVESQLRDRVSGGVALEGDAKVRFNAIQQELSALSTQFANNLLDATKAFVRVLTTHAEVAGLPPSALALAAQTAAAKGHPGATAEAGPWAITLDGPSFSPVMSHAKNRALREEVYRAYLSRASAPGCDNGPLIERILALKHERAVLVGYPNAAEASLASKMATLPAAEALLEELRAAAYPAAVGELAAVRAIAAAAGAAEAVEPGGLKHWDVAFWAERLREREYDLEEEMLRPYFAFPDVLAGLFGLASRLFGVTVVPADGTAPVWHPDVRFFELRTPEGAPVAHFYLDPYSRPAEKRGGAWMDEVVGRSALMGTPGAPRLPVAHMVCNQSPPVGGAPSLMTHREVQTLAHEFGHALQAEGMVAGIRGVEWDAVELPSQFMENWTFDQQTLDGMARHHKTGAPLPPALFAKLLAAKNFRAASQTLRQVHFAATDLELHARYAAAAAAGAATPGGVYAVEKRVAERTCVLPPLPGDRFLNGFSHIFAGGYAAGYYSYKWAEVLSADAFAAFEDAGLGDEAAVRTVGRRFRDTVLAEGGGRAPLAVFTAFRGRGPSTEALLRHSGLTPAVGAK